MSPRLVSFLVKLARFLRSRTGAALVVMLICSAIVSAVLHSREPEPAYQNISASQWLELASTNGQKTLDAIIAFREMGPAGAEYLGQELLRQPSSMEVWLLAHHQSIPDPLKRLLLKPHHQPKEEVILRLLTGLRTNAAPAVPQLVTWLETQRSAVLSRVVSAQNTFSLTSNYIQRLSPSGKMVLQPHSLMVSTTQSNRLQQIVIPPGGVLILQTQMTVLTPGTVSTNIIVSVRAASNSIPWAAYDLLRTIGGDDPRIIMQLLRPVENRAFNDVPQFGTNLKVAASRSVPLLIQKAASPDPREKLSALALLRLTVPESSAATEQFIRTLRENDYQAFELAMGALRANTNDIGRIVPLALDGVRRRSSMTPPPSYYRINSTFPALKEFSRHSPLVIPGLQEILRQTTNGPDLNIVQLLGEIGTTNDIDLALLGSFTNHHANPVRAKAWFALGSITGDPEAKVMEQLTLLEGGAVWSAYIKLGELGPLAGQAVPQIRTGLKDKEIRIVAKAAETLGKIGPAAKEALPDLETLRAHPQLLVREPVAEAIRKITTEPVPKQPAP